MSVSPHITKLAASEHHPDIRILKRLPAIRSEKTNEPFSSNIIILDCETTGLNHTQDEIIELAMIKDSLGSDGSLGPIIDTYSAFHEPAKPISADISRITGITAADVAGHKINPDTVRKFVGNPDLIVTHNASFDRKFIEKTWPLFEHINWACSLQDIPWASMEFETTKLKYLLIDMGFFYTQHRALEDCNAVYHALRYCPPQNGNINCFHLLKANAQQVTYRIPVYNSPFGKKDLLKHRGYRWQETGDKHPKHWFIDLTADRIASEIEYLCKVIYERDLEIIPRQLDAKNRYSVRV